MPSLGAWQKLGLALMVMSLFVQHVAPISCMAEGVIEEGRYHTVRQRFKRWLKIHA